MGKKQMLAFEASANEKVSVYTLKNKAVVEITTAFEKDGQEIAVKKIFAGVAPAGFQSLVEDWNLLLELGTPIPKLLIAIEGQSFSYKDKTTGQIVLVNKEPKYSWLKRINLNF